MATSNGSETGYATEENKSYAGCTASVILITKTELYCANAGDSRTVLCKKGRAKDLSVDHKPDLPSERNRIEKANGFVEDKRVNGMLALSRALGDFDYKGNSQLKPHD
jgi:serine/threonine protein phosphatase PrpC